MTAPDSSLPENMRLLFVVAEDFYFLSHRLHLARACRDAGAEVHVATTVGGGGSAIEAEGFLLHPVIFDRRGMNPLREVGAIHSLAKVMQAVQPDLVHLVALKPILYGVLAARLARVPRVVAAVAGMGYVFTGDGIKRAALRQLVTLWYRLFLRGRSDVSAIVQNPDDRHDLITLGLLNQDQIFVVPGSGVDTVRFAPLSPPPSLPLRVLTHSRMLWDKGIGELVRAAKLLASRGIVAEILLAGEPDPMNPAAIPEDTLRLWDGVAGVRWLGRRTDIPELLASVHIACLPSYREGLPLSLIEAASSGLPLVATDVPGCREICRHEENGLLVPARDETALADALQRLASDAELRVRMGKKSRELAETVFSKEAVVGGSFAVYRRLLNDRWPS